MACFSRCRARMHNNKSMSQLLKSLGLGSVVLLLPLALGTIVMNPIDLILYLNPLSVGTISIYVIVSFIQRFRNNRSFSRVTMLLCLIWSAAVPLMAGFFNSNLYLTIFHKLVFIFVFDSVVAALYIFFVSRFGPYLLARLDQHKL